MIYSEIAAGKQMILGGISCATPSKVISIPSTDDVVDFCPCDFFCEYVEDAFVYPTDAEDTYRNDYRSILLTLRDESSTYEFFLVKNGVETPLTDDTYGELFEAGFNTLQPLKVGYRIDWLNVFLNLGGGIYTIKVKQTDFGNTVEKESSKINVRLFSEGLSDGTVKIETVQKGVILNGEDFGGMEWANMIRLDGGFGNEEYQYEIDRQQDSNYEDYDVQTSKINQYKLFTRALPSNLGEKLTGEDVLTDDIYISNYNVLAYKQYRRLPVVFEGTVEPSNDYSRNSNKSFIITFKDKQTTLKRNFV